MNIKVISWDYKKKPKLKQFFNNINVCMLGSTQILFSFNIQLFSLLYIYFIYIISNEEQMISNKKKKKYTHIDIIIDLRKRIYITYYTR